MLMVPVNLCTLGVDGLVHVERDGGRPLCGQRITGREPARLPPGIQVTKENLCRLCKHRVEACLGRVLEPQAGVRGG